MGTEVSAVFVACLFDSLCAFERLAGLPFARAFLFEPPRESLFLGAISIVLLAGLDKVELALKDSGPADLGTKGQAYCVGHWSGLTDQAIGRPCVSCSTCLVARFLSSSAISAIVGLE